MKVNEIFYSLQGEGHFTGTAAVFVRLSGCNLRCPFCDTDHSAAIEMSAEDIVAEVTRHPSRHVVITGGEPALQLTQELTDALHRAGCFIQVETNGTLTLPAGIDWITCSPKDAPVVHTAVDELKVLFMGDGNDAARLAALGKTVARERRLQPCDTADADRNAAIVSGCISYIKEHPCWKLSLQTHKILNIR